MNQNQARFNFQRAPLKEQSNSEPFNNNHSNAKHANNSRLNQQNIENMQKRLQPMHHLHSNSLSGDEENRAPSHVSTKSYYRTRIQELEHTIDTNENIVHNVKNELLAVSKTEAEQWSNNVSNIIQELENVEKEKALLEEKVLELKDVQQKNVQQIQRCTNTIDERVKQSKIDEQQIQQLRRDKQLTQSQFQSFRETEFMMDECSMSVLCQKLNIEGTNFNALSAFVANTHKLQNEYQNLNAKCEQHLNTIHSQSQEMHLKNSELKSLHMSLSLLSCAWCQCNDRLRAMALAEPLVRDCAFWSIVSYVVFFLNVCVAFAYYLDLEGMRAPYCCAGTYFMIFEGIFTLYIPIFWNHFVPKHGNTSVMRHIIFAVTFTHGMILVLLIVDIPLQIEDDLPAEVRDTSVILGYVDIIFNVFGICAIGRLFYFGAQLWYKWRADADESRVDHYRPNVEPPNAEDPNAGGVYTENEEKQSLNLDNP